MGAGEGSDRAPAAPQVERMRARFEAAATPGGSPDGDITKSVDYVLRITRVRDVAPLDAGDALPPGAGLAIEDYDSVPVDGEGGGEVPLRRVEILQGFTFDPDRGTVSGTLLFDRVVPAVTPVTEATAPEPVAPAVVHTGVVVEAGTGATQHFEALLAWRDAATDLDLHGMHLVGDALQSHVWHGHRPLGPVFWHFGPSTPSALDERLVITSAATEGVIVCAVHAPGSVGARAIAESGARVTLQLPNTRQSMHFEPPAGDGNFWVPFIIVDGRVVTTDLLASVSQLPPDDVLRALLGREPTTHPAKVTVPDLRVAADEPQPSGGSSWFDLPWFGIGTLAVLLTFLVGSLRGAERAMIMGAVGLAVALLVARRR